MHCPTCGQQQVSDQTRFCSRCGFPLAGVAEIVANHGLVPARKTGLIGTLDSPRRRGVKQGVFVFLLTFLIVPILALLSLALNVEPFMPAIGAFLFGIGGILRIIYALLFDSATANRVDIPATLVSPVGAENRGALPSSYSVPASAYTTPAAGSWRDTNDLQHQQPGSVTDSTTKLLQKEEDR